MEQDAGHLAEDVRDRDAGVEQGRDHSPKEGHVGGCAEAMAGDVADDEGQSSTIEEEPLIPVASDRRRVAGREVASGGLEPGLHREFAQQTGRELDDELVVGVVALGAFDRGRAQLGDGVKSALELGVERCRCRPREADHSDEASVFAIQR